MLDTWPACSDLGVFQWHLMEAGYVTDLFHLLAVINLGGALRDFEFYYFQLRIFLIFAVYGSWEDLRAWKSLLPDMPMIYQQFWKFSKMTQNREVPTFFPAAGFYPKQYKKIDLPAKAPLS